MTEIIFAKPGHHYDSYTDLFNLVKLSGFPIIHLSNVDISRPAVYIVAPHNGEWDPHIKAQYQDLPVKPSKIVHRHFPPRQREIPQVIYCVFWSHDLIPPPYKFRVHLTDVRERPIAIFQDVRMSEASVMVSGEKDSPTIVASLVTHRLFPTPFPAYP